MLNRPTTANPASFGFDEAVCAPTHRLWRSDAPAAEASASLVTDALPDEAIDELQSLVAGGTWEVLENRPLNMHR